MHPEAAEALKKWDDGDIVWTIEVGGLGPGYEQCIHILVFEIIRDDEPLAGAKPPTNFGEAAIKRTSPWVGSFSGAQVGAARSLAAAYMREGLSKVAEHVDKDRRIMVSKAWPIPPARDEGGPVPRTPEEWVAHLADRFGSIIARQTGAVTSNDFWAYLVFAMRMSADHSIVKWGEGKGLDPQPPGGGLPIPRRGP